MKIGVICPYDIIKGGGVQEIVKSQVAGLRARGHEAYVITPRPSKFAGKPDEHTIFVGRSTDFRLPTRTTIQVSTNGGDEADELLENGQFDVLHFHEPWVPALGPYMLPRSRAVNVATFHGKLPEGAAVKALSSVIKPYAKSVIKYIDVFTAASEPGAEYIRSLTPQPVTVVPVDIDLKVFVPPKTFDDGRQAKTILYVGRLEGRKGVKYLLRAFGLLQEARPKVLLDILGKGPDQAKLEILAEDLGLKRVKFLGYRDNAEKLRRLQTADLYCSPAIYGEGFGKVLLEAMATGLPSVVGDNPGYASVMKGVGALSLVNPRDTPEFARRLELLLYEKELRALWRKWAAREVRQYSTENMVCRYEELYKKALAGKK